MYMNILKLFDSFQIIYTKERAVREHSGALSKALGTPLNVFGNYHFLN